MTDADRINHLYWQIVWTIEPALHGHIPRFDEPIEERSARLRMETLAKGKAKSILDDMHEMGFLPARITPSSDAP